MHSHLFMVFNKLYELPYFGLSEQIVVVVVGRLMTAVNMSYSANVQSFLW